MEDILFKMLKNEIENMLLSFDCGLDNVKTKNFVRNFKRTQLIIERLLNNNSLPILVGQDLYEIQQEVSEEIIDKYNRKFLV